MANSSGKPIISYSNPSGGVERSWKNIRCNSWKSFYATPTRMCLITEEYLRKMEGKARRGRNPRREQIIQIPANKLPNSRAGRG